MTSVLIVEDSSMVMKILKHLASRLLSFDTVYATSRAEALNLLETKDDWLAAIVDLNLPDAPNGEVIDDTLSRGISTIVLTGNMDGDRREDLIRRGIVDYVLKEGRYSYQYAVNLVNRLHANRDIRVLVAEDSNLTRKYIAELLRRHHFQVVEAADGQEALDAILADDDIKILLTDYNMPKLNGFELIRSLRHKHEKQDLVIIGLSSADDKTLSARFIKNGANDFLFKPFSHEEFSCRVMHAVTSVERLEQLRALAYEDPLTGIGNRRFFIEKARNMLEVSKETESPLTLAILDIDHFKQVNDTYGHDVGDEVLKHFASVLSARFGRFVLARTGGEEFCVLFPGLDVPRAHQLMDAVRAQIASEEVKTATGPITVTFSCGLADIPVDHIEALMKEADELLYDAKDAGRNRIVISE